MAVSPQLHTAIYDLDYFTGSQCFLYIGDVWIDEVTSLQYEQTQEKTSLFGYASQLRDDVAAGHVNVRGTFSINFKESGYLWIILRRHFNAASDATYGANEGLKSPNYKDAKLGITSSKTIKDRRAVWGSNGTRIARESIERIAQGNATRGEEYQFYQDMAGFATMGVSSPKDKVFEDIVEEFEDQIWSKSINNYDLNNQIRRSDDNAFDGFDIYVVFGNYSTPGANHTVNKIIGVTLTGVSKSVMIDGSPIQEVYEFTAQSVV